MQTVNKPLTLKIPQKTNLEEDGFLAHHFARQSNSATHHAASTHTHVRIASLFPFTDLNEQCIENKPSPPKQDSLEVQSHAQRILQLEQTVEALAASMHTALAGLDELVREKERALMQHVETVLAEHRANEHALQTPKGLFSPAQSTAAREPKKSARSERICATALTLKKTQSTLKKALSPGGGLRSAKRGENRPMHEAPSNSKNRTRLLTQQEQQLGKLMSARELQALPISQFRNKASALLQTRSGKGTSSQMLQGTANA